LQPCFTHQQVIARRLAWKTPLAESSNPHRHHNKEGWRTNLVDRFDQSIRIDWIERCGFSTDDVPVAVSGACRNCPKGQTMKNLLKYSLMVAILGIGASTMANAYPGWDDHHPHDPAPEVDPGMALSALTLLGGTLAVARTRRKQ
jgi:hypothetical protein